MHRVNPSTVLYVRLTAFLQKSEILVLMQSLLGTVFVLDNHGLRWRNSARIIINWSDELLALLEIL